MLGNYLFSGLEQEVSKPLEVNSNLEVLPKFAIGHVQFPKDGTSLETLLQKGDELMYKHKKYMKSE